MSGTFATEARTATSNGAAMKQLGASQHEDFGIDQTKSSADFGHHQVQPALARRVGIVQQLHHSRVRRCLPWLTFDDATQPLTGWIGLDQESRLLASWSHHHQIGTQRLSMLGKFRS